MQVKTKTLIVGGLAVLMVGLLWFRVVYSPITSKTSKANAAAHNAEVDVTNLQHAIDDIMATNKKNAAKDVGTAKMLKAIPADAAEASFLRSLDAIRVSTGANWQSVTPSAPTASGGVTSISVSISVFGSEDQLARYLSGLYAMRRVFLPDNVTLTPQGSTALPGQAGPPAGALFQGGLIQMQIAGRIFSGPAAVETPATGTAGAVSTGAATTGTTAAPTH